VDPTHPALDHWRSRLRGAVRSGRPAHQPAGGRGRRLAGRADVGGDAL